MLSQKQILRKSALPMKPSCKSLHYCSYNNKCDDETESVTEADLQSMDLSDSTRSDSTPTDSSRTYESLYDESYRTTADHIPLGLDSNVNSVSEIIVQSTPRKSVSFSNLVRVCLVPCRKELMVLRDYIWWSTVDMDLFKLDAFMEIKQFIECNRCNLKTAMIVMYQPMEMEPMFLN